MANTWKGCIANKACVVNMACVVKNDLCSIDSLCSGRYLCGGGCLCSEEGISLKLGPYIYYYYVANLICNILMSSPGISKFSNVRVIDIC